MSAPGLLVEFYRQWRAFPHTETGGIDDGVQLTVHDDSGMLYEFSVDHVGSNPDTRSLIGLQVKVFDDAWQAFTDLAQFFTRLRELGRDASKDGLEPDLDDVEDLCRQLGYIEVTDRLNTPPVKEPDRLEAALTGVAVDYAIPPAALAAACRPVLEELNRR